MRAAAGVCLWGKTDRLQIIRTVSQSAARQDSGHPWRRVPLLPLIAATYFMVSGGPYGLEDIVGQAGYARALLLLCIVPVLWSLPTALMVGELASAMPEEGGFYVWVTRALGRFWGFQEAWLSLVASIFDMAIYPALAVAYLAQLDPALVAGSRGVLLSVAIVALCVAWNLRGALTVGRSSLWMFALLLTPFIGILLFGLWSTAAPFHAVSFGTRPLHGSLTTALLFAMWNYMGWDNSSTIAREVENPQRNYIRAMLAAVLLVTFSYVLPVAVVALAGVPASTFVTGAWAAAARSLAAAHVGARAAAWLGISVVAGGALTGLAMFNSLTLSYARVPASMAEDGLLPKVFARHLSNGVPWVAVLACGAAWALALGLALTRLLELDIMLYGLSLVLEFVALVRLRLREPAMPRPFRIPGGRIVLSAIATVPSALVFFAVWAARGDRLTAGVPAIALGAALILAGPLLYGAFGMGRRIP